MAVTNDFTQVTDKIFAMGLSALRRFAVMPRLVNTSWGTEVAQQGDVINVPLPSSVTIDDVTPAAVPPAGGDTIPTRAQITLNRWRETSMHLTDKEAREIAAGGNAGQVSEHIAVIAEDVNSYILGLYPAFYGVVGSPGTTPLGSDLTDVTAARKLLNLQRAPMDPRRVVLGPDAMANGLNLRAIQDASFRRNGEDTTSSGMVGTLLGFTWHEDQQIPTHTRNALGAGALTINGVNALGATSISIAKGAGANWSAKRGDVFTIAGDTQQYVITADTTVTQNTNTTVPISPALKSATSGGEAITTVDTHVVNLAFHRDAIALAVRPVAPADGFTGGNEFRTGIDPVTGLAISLEVSRQHARTAWTWRILYGASVIRPELGVRIAG